MSSTYSTNLALELMGTGDQAGNWGQTTNINLGTLIEQAISGIVTQAITDGADTVITIPNGATGVARNMVIECTGTLTAARNLIVPTNKKLYFIYNNTSGGYAVTVKVSGQTGVSVPNGAKVILMMNSAGTDIVAATNYMPTLTLGTPLATSQGGTGATGASTGSGGPVLSTSPTITTPTLNSPTLVTAALGTPASGTMTNVTGLPLTTGVTGILPIANGGNNSAATPTAGGIVYGDGSSHQVSAAGTAGQVLVSNGTSAPGWTNAATGTVTSIATGNGLSGGTITTSGTLTLGSVAFNTIGSYAVGNITNTGTLSINPGDTLSAGTGNGQFKCMNQSTGNPTSNAASGTWRFMSFGAFAQCGQPIQGVMCVKIA
jgi:hypothetical protein